MLFSDWVLYWTVMICWICKKLWSAKARLSMRKNNNDVYGQICLHRWKIQEGSFPAEKNNWGAELPFGNRLWQQCWLVLWTRKCARLCQLLHPLHSRWVSVSRFWSWTGNDRYRPPNLMVNDALIENYQCLNILRLHVANVLRKQNRYLWSGIFHVLICCVVFMGGVRVCQMCFGKNAVSQHLEEKKSETAKKCWCAMSQLTFTRCSFQFHLPVIFSSEIVSITNSTLCWLRNTWFIVWPNKWNVTLFLWVHNAISRTVGTPWAGTRHTLVLSGYPFSGALLQDTTLVAGGGVTHQCEATNITLAKGLDFCANCSYISPDGSSICVFHDSGR